jgi:hypothetical protein
MKKNLLWGALVIAGFPFLSSCDKDEDTPIAGISFELTEQEENESDGTTSSIHPDLTTDGGGREIEVKLVFDRATAEIVVLKYNVGGTAVQVNPSGNAVNDFSLSAGDGVSDLDDDEITIEKGVTEASIIVTLYEDYSFEYNEDAGLDETVTLELESVVSGPVKLGEQNIAYTLTIVEDDPVILLQWAVNGSTAAADVNTVDMDLFVWRDGNLVNSSQYNNADATQALPYEALFFPAGFPEDTYGLSYTYFAGASDDVDFTAVMFGTFNGTTYSYDEEDDYIAFTGTYTTANINKYDDSGIAPQVVQTMVKDGINFTQISDIVEPSSGSRIGSPIEPFKFNYDIIKKIKVLREMKSSKDGLLR